MAGAAIKLLYVARSRSIAGKNEISNGRMVSEMEMIMIPAAQKANPVVYCTPDFFRSLEVCAGLTSVFMVFILTCFTPASSDLIRFHECYILSN
jgi:hypothetical protein